jgi:hypothetical protein
MKIKTGPGCRAATGTRRITSTKRRNPRAKPGHDHPKSERQRISEHLSLAKRDIAAGENSFRSAAEVMLEYFRFASVDSASWITVAKYGGILVPIFNCGQPDFSHRPRVISVTERSSRRYNHFKWLGPFRREQTEHFLQVSGTSLPEIIESRAARMRMCIRFYQGLAQCTGTKIYFVSSFEHVICEALARCGARSHLLSFADLKNKRSGALENYCRQFKTDPDPTRRMGR